MKSNFSCNYPDRVNTNGSSDFERKPALPFSELSPSISLGFRHVVSASFVSVIDSEPSGFV